MQKQKNAARNIAAQREWYGEPLGDRVRRLMVAFNVSQAHLAEVLGLSPPMLSQLMSGRRAKIGNPMVLARMVLLERQVLVPEVAAGDPEAIRAALERVRNARPAVGHGTLPITPGPAALGAPALGAPEPAHPSPPDEPGTTDEEPLLPGLRALADPAELAAAAGRLQDRFPRLAELLRRAAQTP